MKRIVCVFLALLFSASVVYADSMSEYYSLYEEYCDSSFQDDTIKQQMIDKLEEHLLQYPDDFWGLVYLQELKGLNLGRAEYAQRACEIAEGEIIAYVPFLWYYTEATWICSYIWTWTGDVDASWKEAAPQIATNVLMGTSELKDYIENLPAKFSEFNYEEIFAYRIYINGLLCMLNVDLSFYDIEYGEEVLRGAIDNLISACIGPGNTPRSPELLKYVYLNASDYYQYIGDSDNAMRYKQQADDLNVENVPDISMRYLKQSGWILKLLNDY